MTTVNSNTSAVTQSVEELVNARPDVDNRAVFEQLTALFAELRRKVESRLELKLDPSCEDIEPYRNLKGEVTGSVSNFSGPEVDWAVSSWMGTKAFVPPLNKDGLVANQSAHSCDFIASTNSLLISSTGKSGETAIMCEGMRA